MLTRHRQDLQRLQNFGFKLRAYWFIDVANFEDLRQQCTIADATSHLTVKFLELRKHVQDGEEGHTYFVMNMYSVANGTPVYEYTSITNMPGLSIFTLSCKEEKKEVNVCSVQTLVLK